MSNDAPVPIPDDEVVALAKAAFSHSRQDISQRGPDAPREVQQQHTGITIDLGHKNIARLPDEVVDVIRQEIERLALSHNLLQTLPSRLIECRRLRYLNVRYNAMREIPSAILEMTSLEILDVSRNKIRAVPPQIVNLTSLKVLAIAKNKIEELPVSLGEMNTLQVLKLDSNPLTFPPPDVCTIRDNAPSPSNENERDAVIATQVKKFMRQQASKQRQRAELERLRVESSSDESWTESNPETPRPNKRAAGARFPVRPSVSTLDGFAEGRADSPGLAGPLIPGAPPIPSRSHFRVSSQTSNNGTKIRPPISPLVLTNGLNERNRSQSEGAGPSTHRQKRMGIYTNKHQPSEQLGSVDELRRTSHFRGFSQGIVIPSITANGVSGPATAIGYGDTGTVRSLANRPLSDVREHRRGSRAPDIVVEAARNFLYAISQLHDCVSHMVRAIKLTTRPKEALRRKEDFYRRFSSAYLNIRALSDVLNKFGRLVEEDEEEAQRLSRSVYMYALRCLESFMSITLSIAENRVEITQNANPQVLRTFLFLQQGSLIEMRNACSVLGAQFKDTLESSRRPSAADAPSTVRAKPRVRRFPTSPPQRSQYQVPPPVILHSNENSRTNTMNSISAATPRSGESFSTLATTMTRSNTMNSSFDESDEDAQFDKVYQKLKHASESCRAAIPQATRLLREQFDALRRDLDNDHPRIKALASLIDKSNEVQQMTIPLANRLSQMQLKDSYTRNQTDFWQQCMGFIKAWGELASAYKQQGKDHKLLSSELKQLLKPLHMTVKEASAAIYSSPWSHLTSNNPTSMGPPSLSSITSRTQPPRFHNRPGLSASGHPSYLSNINTQVPTANSNYSAQPYSTASLLSQGSGGYGTPATPLSAALGAAAQATVPNTPKFPPGHGSGTLNVFERADRLLSQTSRRI
ncbi:RAM signaling pathway protein-domain-containing protein [Boeremia exigua]|uniref:RAM signaling pathway protein-domain-containing protein n=1 Tax=Boeremia exigua TaxID=749465 RepID=UPI001E8E8CD2|nr:RAM signaling pathway protein-domain-containing protein [Boeremia exigua]KAH6639720.1 RAM signaling pathway protein-domain-containing protein [Boeremia exigua]